LAVGLHLESGGDEGGGGALGEGLLFDAFDADWALLEAVDNAAGAAGVEQDEGFRVFEQAGVGVEIAAGGDALAAGFEQVHFEGGFGAGLFEVWP
jgi:hypothetical protein